ncbi:hypothetical protein scyTo_0015596 [Scyliorhinus torazame]|uniref:Uncharacterized protein n=1 Tax=Scyliorhinus torazame TaxID=75743 RepID=A0A401PV98_SCYTO|nr:hypothetical protein [Scyliorhinus torazame]
MQVPLNRYHCISILTGLSSSKKKLSKRPGYMKKDVEQSGLMVVMALVTLELILAPSLCQQAVYRSRMLAPRSVKWKRVLISSVTSGYESSISAFDQKCNSLLRKYEPILQDCLLENRMTLKASIMIVL